MKNLLLVFVLFLSALSNKSAASNCDLFSMNEDQVSKSLYQATEIESYVLTHGQANLSELSKNIEVNNKLNLGNFNVSAASFTFDDMNWTAWAWGFCCWPIGIFTVIVKDGSTREDKISYLLGIGTGCILSIPGYFLNAYYYAGY